MKRNARRKARQESAAARQAIYDGLSRDEKVKRLYAAPGRSNRQRVKLGLPS